MRSSVTGSAPTVRPSSSINRPGRRDPALLTSRTQWVSNGACSHSPIIARTTKVDEEQRREHRGTVDEVLETAGRQAVDVRDEVEVEPRESGRDLQRQDGHREAKEWLGLQDAHEIS